MNEAEKLKSTLSSIFKRKGGNGLETRLFEDLDAAERIILLNAVELKERELPVIGSFREPDNWLLITTERVIWRSGEKRQSLDADHIRDVHVDFRKLVSTAHGKSDLRQLQIKTIFETIYTIEVEEGAPLSGVWNALKNFGARTRSRGVVQP